MIFHVQVTIDEPTAQEAAVAYLKIQKAYKPPFRDHHPVAYRAEDQTPFDIAVAKLSRDAEKPAHPKQG